MKVNADIDNKGVSLHSVIGPPFEALVLLLSIMIASYDSLFYHRRLAHSSINGVFFTGSGTIFLSFCPILRKSEGLQAALPYLQRTHLRFIAGELFVAVCRYTRISSHFPFTLLCQRHSRIEGYSCRNLPNCCHCCFSPSSFFAVYK